MDACTKYMQGNLASRSMLSESHMHSITTEIFIGRAHNLRARNGIIDMYLQMNDMAGPVV